VAQIRLVTEVPGPKSREMKARHERFVARGLTLGFPAFIREAQGAMLTDVDGNRFVDLAGGVGVMNLGYSDEDVLGAAREQLRRFVHTDYTVAPYGIDTKVAERLVGLIKGAGKAAFFNSGSEAVENSMKMARAYTGRKAIISFEGGFHGRTWMALSLTSKTMPYKQGFLPLAPEVYRLPYAYPYRPPVEPRAGESFGEACAALLDKTFVQIVAAKDVAALIVEPVQGEGGFVVPPEDYLPALKKRCEEHGIVFIADEVQTVSAGRARCLPSSIPGSSRTSSSWRSPSRRECRSRRWSAGPRSWTPRSRGASAGPTRATLWHSRAPRPFWISSRTGSFCVGAARSGSE
jgi:4-aminobutyrate aminotransferase / (S)-3-amino-2-methylpropionate transaminase / 5-aminovalerate transaminase